MSHHRSTATSLRARLRQRGAALAETVVVLPVLFLLGLGALQWALVYEAKSALGYAAFMGARAGALDHANPQAIRIGFARGLAPLYSPETNAAGQLQAMAQVGADILAKQVHFAILNPTREAFTDFGQDLNEDGRAEEIPNRDLGYQETTRGAASGVNLQDANLLKLEVLYGHRLKVPFVGPLTAEIGEALTRDPVKRRMLRAGRLPLLASATVRMQTDAHQNPWVLSKADVTRAVVTGSTPETDPSAGTGSGNPPGGNPDGSPGGGGNDPFPGTDPADLPASPVPGGPTDPLCSLADTCDPDDNGLNNGDTTTCTETTAPPAAQPSSVQDTNIGNPIHVVTGNKHQREEDLAALPGALGLHFLRHYNSRSRSNGPMGRRWTHGYDLLLVPVEDGYRLRQGDGRWIAFRARDGSATHFDAQLASDGWLRQDAGETTWHWRNGRRLYFTPAGRLSAIAGAGRALVNLFYDADGRLALLTDPQGRRLRLRYDRNGRLQRLLDPAGQAITYAYDDHGNLARVTLADGRTRQYHYEDPHDPHHLTGLTDARGIRYATWAYDAQGRAIRSEHAGGVGRVSLDFSTAGQTRVTDSLGRESVYHTEIRDGIALVTQIDGPGCSSCGTGDVRHTYDERFQRIATTAKDGSTTHYQYDAQGRTTEIHKTFADGTQQRLVRYEYQGDSLTPSAILRPSINPNGAHRIEIAYDADQQPTAITERGYTPTETGGFAPIERTTTLTYAGRDLIAIDGPRDDVEDILRLSYGHRHRLETLTTPDGRTQQVLDYDAYGRPTRLQSGRQTPVELRYNDRGQPLEIRQGARAVRYAYTPDGQLQSLTGPDGQTLTLAYDDAGRATQLTGPDGRQVHNEIDTEGRLTQRHLLSAQGQLIQSLSHLYDAQGRLQSTQRNGELAEQYDYDASDRLHQITDGAGNNTRIDYGPLGQLQRLIAPDQSQVSLHYDDKGQAIGLTDPRDNTTEQRKDDFGRVVQASNPDTGSVTSAYDEAGNRIQKTDAEGHRTTYRYDAANRLIEEATPDGTTTLSYDPQSGRLSEIQGPSTTETFQYNREGQLIAHTREIDGHAFTTQYAYNDQQKLRQKTLPDGQILNYHYYADGNQQGKLRAITQQTLFGLSQHTLIGAIDHDPSDGVTGHTYGNGIRTEHHFDESGQLTRITNHHTLQLHYTYDASGQITGIDLNGTFQHYRYDPLGRLIGADTTLGSYRYAYDPVGNRTAKQHIDPDGNLTTESYRYPEAGEGNRLLSLALQGQGRGEGENAQSSTSEQQDLIYNEAGSPIQTDGLRYEYNAHQRPVKVYKTNADTQQKTLIAEYRYNRFGERIKKVVYRNPKQPKVTYYLYDGHTLTAEANEQGEITAQYLYLKGHQPIAKLEDKQVYAIHSDHLGTPRAATNDQGETVWQADYSPFGQAEIKTQQITLNLRLPGQYADSETGTYYNYFRDYDPKTGRYQTSDPIGLKGGLNTYAYVGGNPLSEMDPLGLKVTFYERRIGATFLGGHTFLILSPDNPDEVQRLLNSLIPGGIPAFNGGASLTLSGMNSTNPVTGNLELDGITNWEQDIPALTRFNKELMAPDYSNLTDTCSIYSDDSLFIANLIFAYRSYITPLSYDGLAGEFPNSRLRGPGKPLPTLKAGVNYYNSNSFTAGLLVAAGHQLSAIPDPIFYQPGLDKPIPLSPVY